MLGIDLTILIWVSGLVVNRFVVIFAKAVMVWWVIMWKGRVIKLIFVMLIWLVIFISADLDCNDYCESQVVQK